MKRVKVFIDNFTTVKVVGVNREISSLLSEKFKLRATHYKYSASYKTGRWDGFYRYIYNITNNSFCTYQRLFPKVLKEMQFYGVGDIELIDTRPKVKPLSISSIDENFLNDVIHPKTQKPLVLFDHQVKCINKMLESNYGIVESATGSGKTTIIAAMLRIFEYSDNLPSVVIVPDKTLIAQGEEYFKQIGLDVGVIGDGRKEFDHKHVIATWQSLRKFPEEIARFKALILDECHKATSPEIRKIIIEHGSKIPYRYGVTGSLPKHKTDRLMVRMALGKTLCKVTASELTDIGMLATCKIYIVPTKISFDSEYEEYYKSSRELGMHPVSLNEFIKMQFKDPVDERRFLANHEERIKWVAEFADLVRQHRGNTLVLTQGVKFAKKVAEHVEEGYGFYVDMKTKSSTRLEYFDLINKSDNLLLAGTAKLASTGIDIPRLFNVIFVDIESSYTRIVQSIGRGLRKAEDKSHVDIFDICSTLPASTKFIARRRDIYKEQKIEHVEVPEIEFQKTLPEELLKRMGVIQ